MLENVLIFALSGLAFMSLLVIGLSFWNLKLQDDNDRMKIEKAGDTPPF